MTYKHTERACFIGYIVQAVVNNFVPLLFLTFQNQFGIPLSQVTVLITLNFLLQLAVDGASVFFIDRIGYRASALLAHGFAALGLISPDRRRLRLAVWRLGGQQDTVEIALDRYLLSASSSLEQGVAPPDLRVRAAFPERPDGCAFALAAALLRVTLPQARSAVLLDVTAE